MKISSFLDDEDFAGTKSTDYILAKVKRDFVKKKSCPFVSTTAQRQLSDVSFGLKSKERCQNLIYTFFSEQNNLSSPDRPTKTTLFTSFSMLFLAHESHKMHENTAEKFFVGSYFL